MELMDLVQDVKDKLGRLNVLEKLIAFNVAVYLLGLVWVSIFSTGLNCLELPSDFLDFILQPWSIVTYAFVHYDFVHILFNMLWLYFIGKSFLSLFSAKMALNVYFLGAICGGLLYLLAYNLFPNLLTRTQLVGASAAVRALLIFICAYLPNQEIKFFTFKLKLWYIGVGIVLLDIAGLFGDNTGGNLAHLGGAALGYFYAKQYLKGHDIGKGFERFMNAIFNMFKSSKTAPLRTVHKNKSKVGGYTKGEFNQFNHQKKIDVILDKISKSGYDSLTSEEKEFLFRAGK